MSLHTYSRSLPFPATYWVTVLATRAQLFSPNGITIMCARYLINDKGYVSYVPGVKIGIGWIDRQNQKDELYKSPEYIVNSLK